MLTSYCYSTIVEVQKCNNTILYITVHHLELALDCDDHFHEFVSCHVTHRQPHLFFNSCCMLTSDEVYSNHRISLFGFLLLVQRRQAHQHDLHAHG